MVERICFFANVRHLLLLLNTRSYHVDSEGVLIFLLWYFLLSWNWWKPNWSRVILINLKLYPLKKCNLANNLIFKIILSSSFCFKIIVNSRLSNVSKWQFIWHIIPARPPSILNKTFVLYNLVDNKEKRIRMGLMLVVWMTVYLEKRQLFLLTNVSVSCKYKISHGL